MKEEHLRWDRQRRGAYEVAPAPKAKPPGSKKSVGKSGKRGVNYLLGPNWEENQERRERIRSNAQQAGEARQ